jgi:riboflavin kinase
MSKGTMAAANRTWKAVIFDLDGVLLDSEACVHRVTAELVQRFGKTYDPNRFVHLLGRSPRDAVGRLIEELQLPLTVEEYLALSQPLLLEQWASSPAIPGAARLVLHLHRTGVPIAVATSCDRASLARKLEQHSSWFDAFGERVVTSSEVQASKPAPDLFLRACQLLPGVTPADCIVIEDSPSGIAAARAAGMRSVALVSDAVPSEAYDAAAPDERLLSLYQVDPSAWGFEPFADLVRATVPREPPLRLTGTVVRGFGRGSKELGIPTANLPADAYAELIGATTCGIYHGWAQVDDGPVLKMVTSVGRNPYYANETKTVEPHILYTFTGDFYGATLRLLIVGYIRPEANFSSLEALIAAIHSDIDRARDALDDPFYAKFRSDKLFVPARRD